MGYLKKYKGITDEIADVHEGLYKFLIHFGLKSFRQVSKSAGSRMTSSLTTTNEMETH